MMETVLMILGAGLFGGWIGYRVAAIRAARVILWASQEFRALEARATEMSEELERLRSK